MKRSLFAELKRRNVIRAAILYVGAVWALAQGIAQLTPVVGAPDWAARWFLVAAGIGFPLWLAFAWFFELTPEGFKLERDVAPGDSIMHRTGRKLDFAIIGVLAAAVVLLLTDRFVLHHGVNSDVGATPTIPEIDKDPSIAVLPMVNMSEDKGNEYFSDGISEELLNLLARVPKLRVIARTSSFSFKGKDTSIQDIARALQVAAVLEGSVRKSGDKVRITVQLIRAKDSSHLWSETYDRTLDDIFRVQDEIAANVVDKLKITLLGGAPIAHRIDPKIYPLILQADALASQGTATTRAQAMALYQEALAVDPDEPRSWSGLGRVYFTQHINGIEGVRQAEEALKKAVTLDPGDAVTWARIGFLTVRSGGDLAVAAPYFQRALSLAPTDIKVIGNVLVFLQAIGRIEEAVALAEYVAVHDPANPTTHFNVCASRFYAGRWDRAIESCRIALRLSPGFASAHFFAGVALLLGKNDAQAALQDFEAEPADHLRLTGLTNALHAMHRNDESDSAFAALNATHANDTAYYIATVYAYRDDADHAFEWLDHAIASQNPNLFTAATEPQFVRLHDDPRWLPFLRKIGRAPEQLARIDFKVTLPPDVQAEAAGKTPPAH